MGMKLPTDERGAMMCRVILSLGVALMVLTGCQHQSATMMAEEIGPLLVPQGRNSESPMRIEQAQFLDQEEILPVSVGGSPVNDQSTSSGSDVPHQPDGRHLPLVLFPYDSWTLTPQAKTILEQAGAWLRTYDHGELSVEGHTDPKGTSSYNYALGLRRARTVIRYLVNLGADPQSMVPTSFGEDAPVCHHISAYCDAMNRRAAVFVAQRQAHALFSSLTDFTEGVVHVPIPPHAQDSLTKERH